MEWRKKKKEEEKKGIYCVKGLKRYRFEKVIYMYKIDFTMTIMEFAILDVRSSKL